jgi:hypothetical protein
MEEHIEYVTAIYDKYFKHLRLKGIPPEAATIAAANLTNAVMLSKLTTDGMDITTTQAPSKY